MRIGHSRMMIGHPDLCGDLQGRAAGGGPQQRHGSPAMRTGMSPMRDPNLPAGSRPKGSALSGYEMPAANAHLRSNVIF